MIYNIPAGASFFDTMARWVLQQEDIVNSLIILPSRRSCNALRDAFLRATNGTPIILPQIFPIHSIDAIPELAEFSATLSAPISPLHKKVELAKLIQKVTPNILFEQALNLADELADFLDEIITHDVDLAKLENIVPDDLAVHWQKTLQFLKIVSFNWKGLLAEKGLLDNMELQRLLLEKLNNSLQNQSFKRSNIIFAGHKNYTPQIAGLLKTVSDLPNGTVIFSSIEKTQKVLPPTHPQYHLKKLLSHIDKEYQTLGENSNYDERRNLLQEALKPAKETASWCSATLNIDDALKGLSFEPFKNLEEEAMAISLMLREALETKGKTAICITPDRNLARRVVSHMKRFGIELNDSGGTPLKNISQTIFLRLLAEVVASDFAPIPLLALLKHPCCFCNMERGELLNKTRALEKDLLRGVRPKPEIIKEQFAFLYDEIEPFAALHNNPKVDFQKLIKEHIKVAEIISQNLWNKAEGEAIADFIRDALELEIGDINPQEYTTIFDALLEGQIYRPKFGFHPRIHLLGTIEANLQTSDLVIISGLNEGVFPSYSSSGIWLNNGMREELGLPSKDEKIGLSAHDFYMLACNKEVVLTRAEKIDGVETIPSRWWLRLETFIKLKGGHFLKEKHWKEWIKLFNTPEKFEETQPASANPPVEARPKKLSVTQIDTLMRDPYSIYAKKILRLEKLDEIDEELSVADFGSAVHKALELFAKNPVAREEAYEKLLECGKHKDAFGDMLEQPIVHSFWWSRFERIAKWFIKTHYSRRFDEIVAEQKLEFHGVGGTDFTLTGTADRIEKSQSGDVIIDYKTGTLPTKKDIFSGFSTQLLLLALLTEKNGYNPKGLEYWKLSGNKDKIDDILKSKEVLGIELSEILKETEDMLTEIVNTFFYNQTPFLACPNTEKSPVYNDYTHLERIKEWE